MNVEIDKPDKVLFPDSGLTKADLAEYYRRIAPTMLPYLKDRPLTLHRFPDGIDGPDFIQKNISGHFPDWIARVRVDKEGGTVTHVLAGNADTLRFLVDQGTIALHVWLSRKNKPHYPDRLIFDLDPPDGRFALVIKAARRVREALNENDLESFVMTTGSSGLHVVVPLDRSANFDGVRDFARTTAAGIAERWPDDFTTEQRKKRRGERIYLDVMRNAYAQTAIAPYSVRAIAGAPVATPLDWEELGKSGLGPQSYRVNNIFRRLSQRQCPWRDIDRHAQPLPRAKRKNNQRS